MFTVFLLLFSINFTKITIFIVNLQQNILAAQPLLNLHAANARERWLQIREHLIKADPKRLNNLSKLDCAQVLANNSEYIKKFIAKFGRISINDPPEESFPMDCKSIHERGDFYLDADKDGNEYPIAQARVVNKVNFKCSLKHKKK